MGLEPDLWECEQCGKVCDEGEQFCCYDCAEEALAEDEFEQANRCDHPPSAWRRCAECKAAFGDLQYQRMKEGDL